MPQWLRARAELPAHSIASICDVGNGVWWLDLRWPRFAMVAVGAWQARQRARACKLPCRRAARHLGEPLHYRAMVWPVSRLDLRPLLPTDVITFPISTGQPTNGGGCSVIEATTRAPHPPALAAHRLKLVVLLRLLPLPRASLHLAGNFPRLDLLSAVGMRDPGRCRLVKTASIARCFVSTEPHGTRHLRLSVGRRIFCNFSSQQTAHNDGLYIP